MKIDLHSMVGENCITVEDGNEVYELIFPKLTAGEEIELNFSGVQVFASPFFNAAIGRLLKDLEIEELSRLLTVVLPSPTGQAVLKRVIENSQKFYKDPKVRNATEEVMKERGEDD